MEYEIKVMIYRLSVLTIFLAQALGSLKQSETTLYFFTSVDTTIFYALPLLLRFEGSCVNTFGLSDVKVNVC